METPFESLACSLNRSSKRSTARILLLNHTEKDKRFHGNIHQIDETFYLHDFLMQNDSTERKRKSLDSDYSRMTFHFPSITFSMLKAAKGLNTFSNISLILETTLFLDKTVSLLRNNHSNTPFLFYGST